MERNSVQVAWPHEPSLFPGLKQRLGLIFCFSRACHLVATTHPVAAAPTLSIADSAEPRGPRGGVGGGVPAGEEGSVGGGGVQNGMAAQQPAGQLAKIEFQPPLVSCMEARVDRGHSCGGALVFVSHDQVRPLWTLARCARSECCIQE